MKQVLLGVALAAAVAVPSATAGRPAQKPVKLSLVPLPASVIGAAVHGLTLAQDSGTVSNSQAANQANDTPPAGKLKKLGRLTGYQLDYGDVYAGTTGIDEVQTGVGQYKTAADAAKGLAFWKNDDPKIKILEVLGLQVSDATFPAPAVGSARFGNVWTETVPNVPTVNVADARAVEGAYVLDVKVAAASAPSAETLAGRLLKKLDARLRLAFAGRLHGSPVPLPRRLTPGQAYGGPDLSAIALTPTDVGQGTVSNEGYTIDPEALSDYTSDMSPGGIYSDLSQDIEWYSTPAQATFLAALAATEFSGTVTTFGGQVTPVDLSAIGDDAQGALGVVTLGGPTRYDGVVVLARGQAMEALIVESQSPIQASDLTNLAQLAANKLNAAVAG